MQMLMNFIGAGNQGGGGGFPAGMPDMSQP